MDLRLIQRFYYGLLPEIRQEDWAWLTERFTMRTIPKGGFLQREGEICRRVSFLNSGLLALYYYNTEGKPMVDGFICSGEYVSDYESFLTQKPTDQYLEALEDTTVIELDYQTVQLAYATLPVFQKFGRLMSEFLYLKMSEAIYVRRRDSPEQAYQRILNNNPELLLRVPQYLIAAYIGITPEALSRIRKRLSESKGSKAAPAAESRGR